MLYGVLRTRWTRRGDQMVTGAASTASSAIAEIFGRGLPNVVGEASFDLCGDPHELGVGGLDMVVGGLHQG